MNATPTTASIRTIRPHDPVRDYDPELPAEDWNKSVVVRAFALLGAFSSQEPFFTLGELAERAGLPRSTTHRLAVILVKLGALQRRGNLGYTIGARLYDIGLLAPTRSRLLTAATPFLYQLHEMTRGTVHLATWSGEQPIYLDKVARPGDPRLPSRVGSAVPLHSTALGKCLMAFTTGYTLEPTDGRPLPRFTPYTITNLPPLLRDIEVVKASRIGRDSEESVLGLTCLASPIIGRGDECVAAISISVPTTRLREKAMEQAVLRAAGGISRAYGQGYAA